MFVGCLDGEDTSPGLTAGRSSTWWRDMPEPVDPRHLLLIGAGPGVGAGVVQRFGREGFRSTLISRGGALEQLVGELRAEGLEIEAVAADIEDLDGYRATLERCPCVVVERTSGCSERAARAATGVDGFLRRSANHSLA